MQSGHLSSDVIESAGELWHQPGAIETGPGHWRSVCK